MAVMPFPRRTTFETDEAKPGGISGFDSSKITINVDDDGSVVMDIPTKDAGKAKRKPAANPNDFSRNLAEDLDANALAAIASWLIEGIEADESERSEWEDTALLVTKYLGTKLEPITGVSTEGTVCNMISTAMLEAAAKMWATSYGELLPSDGPVKTKREDSIKAAPPPIGHNGGPPIEDAEPGQEPQDQDDAAGDDLAQALEQDLNWYLTTKDRGYYQDFSKMLMNRNLIGDAFREVYRCPIKKMPISRWLMAQDVILQGDPPDVNDTTGRVTVRRKVAQSTMRRMMMAGEYLDIALVAPTGVVSKTELVIGEAQGLNPTPSLPRDNEHLVYDCICELGSGASYDLFGSLELLDQDETGEKVGYPLPYRVTMDVDSRQVLAIRRFWKEGDEDHRRIRRFIRYGLIPSFGSYHWGLIHLVGNPTLAATMLQRSGVDAGLFANFPAWAMAKSAARRSEGTIFRPMPGHAVEIPLGGSAKIGDVLMPFPYKEPSAQSMALVQKLEADIKSLAGVIELPVGEGRIGNTPVGTIMSYIESVTMVPGAVHKADHASQSEEFQLLRDLIAEEPELLWRGNTSPSRKWQVREEVLSPDISPKADPDTPSQMHRLLKVQGLISAGGQPQFQADAQGPIANNRAVWRRLVTILEGASAAEFEHAPQPQQPPPPPPDPRVQAAQINAQSKEKQGEQRLQADQLEHQQKMAEIAVASADKQADRQAAAQRELMKAGSERHKVGAGMVSDAIGHAQDEKSQSAEHQHQAATQQQEAMNAPLLAPDKGTPSQ